MYTSDSYMHPLANSVGPNEMLHNAAFYQVLHCLLRQKQSSEKEIQFHLEVITCYPSMYEGHLESS